MNFLTVCLMAVSVLGNGARAQGRPLGYYADLETGCKTYHVCDGHSHFTYVCPSRTLFQQRTRICDHSYLVRCEDSSHFYEPENLYPDDYISVGSKESEKSLLSSGNFKDHHNQTEELVTTENLTTVAPGASSDEDFTGPPIEKFLKIHIKDFRYLFFIPEFKNNSVIAKPEGEFLLAVKKSDLMRFKNQKEVSDPFSLCPSHCDPKFFLPGTCHPCIFIK